ncbi:MAG: rhomboid family intramembrane serine protease [Deltaproteobacteria bacterium]|nr:rhomboid family intramembrane serine protease [Deltaproteobacteria bacterium]
MRPVGAPSGFASYPRPGRALMVILIGLPVAYLFELVAMRTFMPDFLSELALSPPAVFSGKVWQPATYVLLHSPVSPGHLFFNLIGFYFLGAPLERWWGARRFAVSSAIFVAAGGALTLGFAGVVMALGAAARFPFLTAGPHLGADGVIAGLSIAFGIVQWNASMQLLLIPVSFTGRTWVLMTLVFEVFSALSFSGVSSTSHIGAMGAAAVLCTGTWKLSTLRSFVKRGSLRAQQRKLEQELRIIEGGRGKKPKKDDLPN